jgi:hypothetical protein
VNRLVSSRRTVKVAFLTAIFAVVALYAAVIASAETVKFTSTGEEQTFRVPAGVTSIHVVATGGRGGNGSGSPKAPGFGATVTGDVLVSPLQLLYVEVGGNGGSATGPAGALGGFNGGGNAGSSGDSPNSGNGGGGGGGASDLRLVPRSAGGSSLESRLITAAGGGGAGGGPSGGFGGSASSAGNGQGGQTGDGIGGGEGGSGATTSAPGGPGLRSGSLGTGGSGQTGSAMVSTGGGAGAGGGIFGGGGGTTGSGGGSSGGGAGAGSSGVGSSVKNSSIAIDSTGVPLITITYTLPSTGGNGNGNGGGNGTGTGPGTGTTGALDTTIDAHPGTLVETRREKARVRFRFSANRAGATFLCKLDFNSFAPCESPKRYRVSPGRHTFKVKAVGDTTPAVFSFRVKHKF